MNEIFEELTDVELLSLCVYGEARNQGLDGMLAVASVIVNRSKHPSWWGSSIKSVILKPWQFSCLNENDPNKKKLENLAADFQAALSNNNSLKACYWIAKGLLDGILFSNVAGATHYHTMAVSPDWKTKLTMTKRVGDHIFYV